MKTALDQAHRALLLVLRRRLLWRAPLCIDAEGSYIGQPIVYIEVGGGDQHGADFNETRLLFYPPVEPLSCIADNCFFFALKRRPLHNSCTALPTITGV